MPQDSSRSGAGIASFNDTVSSPDRESVNDGALLTANLQQLYSLFIWDIDGKEIPIDSSLDPSGTRDRAEYFFNVAPKTIDFSEPFTTRVIATQNGGKHIESHGSIFKEIRVAGTTGLRPRKQAPNTVPLFHTDSFTKVFNPADTFTGARKIPGNEVTGFDDIHFLRNIFRRYSDFKATGRPMIMVWRNIKDDDYWIVEPKEFKLVQASRSPLTYEYNIALQALARFDSMLATVSKLEDPFLDLRSVQRFYSRTQEYQQALLNSFLVVSTQISRLKALGYTSVDSILGPMINVIKGLNSVVSAHNETSKGLERAARDGIANFTDAIDQLHKNLDETSDRDPLIRALRQANRQYFKILTEPKIRDSVAARSGIIQARLTSAFRNPGAGTRPASVPVGLTTGAQGGFNSVAEDIVGRGESIRDLALRLLGDGKRWSELVILNDLRSPYTQDASTFKSGVLNAGDRILYPVRSNGLDGLSINPVNVSPTGDGSLVNPLGDAASQAYGRDIKLISVERDGVSFTDLDISQNGDIETIVGVPNVEQAIRLKFATETGQLPSHPSYGARFSIGSRASISSFNTFRVNTLATLKSDDRISNIANLRFRAVGDVLFVDAQVSLKAAREFLTTSFALRRF